MPTERKPMRGDSDSARLKKDSLRDDVIKWKHFPRYWPFVRGIHRSPVNSPHKGQWRWALMFSLICALTNGWVSNRYIGDLRRHRAHLTSLCGEFTGHRWITLTKASDAEFRAFFELRLTKLLSKQSKRWLFETPSCSLKRHWNGLTCTGKVWDWTSNFIPHFIMDVITCPCCD